MEKNIQKQITYKSIHILLTFTNIHFNEKKVDLQAIYVLLSARAHENSKVLRLHTDKNFHWEFEFLIVMICLKPAN